MSPGKRIARARRDAHNAAIATDEEQSRAGEEAESAVQRLQFSARGFARVHQARRGGGRDRAHHGRRYPSRNGHPGGDREPRAAGAARDPVRGCARLPERHAAALRRDQFVEAAGFDARPAGAARSARRGARLSRPDEDASADPAQDGGERRGVRERRPRRQGRPAQVSGAVSARARRRPLYRHRRPRHHARSRTTTGSMARPTASWCRTRTTSASGSRPASTAARSARSTSRRASPARC